ncbi:MAG: LysM peptidoglycan-binding domain-containing protein [Alistipes sp.]|nr:LysM peptidoglycan-binding domain-containing protein [Alistipes sp.]
MYRSLRIATLLLAGALCLGSGVVSAQTAEQVVYIDGEKFAIHTVVKGDTLYSLARTHEVDMAEIISVNPILSEGLKVGQVIKIPYKEGKQPKRSKKSFDTHIVSRGETFYSIARQYSISVETLLSDNGDIDPAHLAVGTTLYIRRSEVGKTDEVQVKDEIERRSELMNSVMTGDYSYHVVHSGEDAVSIAGRFGTNVETLLALNSMRTEKEVREGLIIKVPKESVVLEEEVTESQDEVGLTGERAEFRKVEPHERAKVSLLLPFSQSGLPLQNYTDFYQGFLLGADKLRMDGYAADIDVYNTGHDHNRIAEILDSESSLAESNLIVGPVYEDELVPVARYAEQRSIPVVSPLANLTATTSDVVFQMSPRADAKYDKVRNLFDGSRKVVVITSETIDKAFNAEVQSILGDTPYDSHHYIYEHPSIIEKRYEEARKQDKEPEPAPSDLAPLLEGEQERVFVILAATEIEVDRILAALASANISLTARSRTVAPFKVFGNSRWNRHRNIDRALFFSNNVVMLSTYHIDRSDARVKEFSTKYVKAFGTLPSLYAYRGYDAAVIFIPALYDGIESGLSEQRLQPLQTPYTFESAEPHGLRVNEEWVRVNYNKNFTITVE